MPVFAVTTGRGPAWDPARPVREQEFWTEHADFADHLVRTGSILLGGPVESGDEGVVALIAVQADDRAGVHALFADDPWVKAGILELADVRAWTIWLDGRPSGADPGQR